MNDESAMTRSAFFQRLRDMRSTKDRQIAKLQKENQDLRELNNLMQSPIKLGSTETRSEMATRLWVERIGFRQADMELLCGLALADLELEDAANDFHDPIQHVTPEDTKRLGQRVIQVKAHRDRTLLAVREQLVRH